MPDSKLEDLRELNKALAKDNVRLTNEAHKAADRWQSALIETESRLKAITEDRNALADEVERLQQENKELRKCDACERNAIDRNCRKHRY